MSRPRLLALSIAAMLIAAAGCGGGAAPIVSYQSAYPTLGELEQMIQNSVEPDADGDFIPDNIEQGVLGTDPTNRDTDRDGLPDNYEIFGEGIFDPDAYVPDNDRDGLIAPRDKDDDGDFVNDGLSIDTDGDYIANYLEYYGYTYDWLTGRFVSCEDVDCTGLTVYRSDPLQRSTDQDVYPDGTEVSGAAMDVSVGHPGNHPLVPAYPELVLELAGYRVTLNGEIEYSRGRKLAQGEEWSRETSSSHTYSGEASWEGGIAVGKQDIVNLNAKIGFKAGYANETGYAVARGGSIVHEQEWSETRSYNPTDAAHLKLLLKVHNKGTSSVSNVVPTLTLKIGGLNVTTFEPGNPQINLLVGGETYPADDGVYWVVDSTATGAPLSLTITELQALETGAPIGVSMTQVKGDVLRLTEDGSWESAGECGEFTARCDAACASLLLDMADGNSVHRMVYAGEGPSAPRVTLEEALGWTANLTVDNGRYEISYRDADGAWLTTSLHEWTFAVDRDTLSANGLDPDDLQGTIPPDFELGKLVLLPQTSITGKAPRTAQLDKPVVHFAKVDEERRKATACATDYRGIEKMEVVAEVDAGGGAAPTIKRWLMEEDTPGSALYVFTFTESDWEIIAGILERRRHPEPGVQDSLVAEATALGGVTDLRPFGEVPPRSRPVAPLITHVTMDIVGQFLYARVVPDPSYPAGWHEEYPVQWVNAFHPAFEGGSVEMKRVSNWFEDPYGVQCDLPLNFDLSNVRIVAWVAPGVYAARTVEAINVAEAHAQGDRISVAAFYDDHLGNYLGIRDYYEAPAISLDVGQPDYPHREFVAYNQPWVLDPFLVGGPFFSSDLWLQMDKSAPAPGWKFGFIWGAARYNGPELFDKIIRDVAKDKVVNDAVTGLQPVVEREIWLLRTVNDRFAKVEVLRRALSGNELYNPFAWRKYYCTTTIRFVVFKNPTAHIAGPDQETFTITPGSTVQLDGRESYRARTYFWDFDPNQGLPPGAAKPTFIGNSQTAEIVEFEPKQAGWYLMVLTINKGEGPSEESAHHKYVQVKFK